jgi:hypothetical protein
VTPSGESFVYRLESFPLKIDMARIIIHKSFKPGTFAPFFETDGLPCESSVEIDLLTEKSDLSAAMVVVCRLLRT